MCEKSGIFNLNSVPTYRTRTITKKTYRTNVPYPYHYKKGVPYQRTVLLSKNRGVPYRTNVPYRTAILEQDLCFHSAIRDTLLLQVYTVTQKWLNVKRGNLPTIYEESLKSNGIVQCARCTNNFYRREKSIAFFDVTMPYGFENQISSFCDYYILFCTFFCQGTFFVTVL